MTSHSGWSFTGRRSLLSILAVGAGATWRRARRAGVLTGAALRVALRFALMAAGLGFLDAAAYGWSHLAGYAAIGLSLLVLEAVVKSTGRAP